MKYYILFRCTNGLYAFLTYCYFIDVSLVDIFRPRFSSPVKNVSEDRKDSLLHELQEFMSSGVFGK